MPYLGFSLLGSAWRLLTIVKDISEHKRPTADQFDKRGTLAKGFDLPLVNHGVRVWRVWVVLSESLLGAPHCGDHFSEVLSGFGFVDVLEVDVIARLGLHVREGAGEGEDLVGRVEAGYGVGDEPEI